MDPTYEFEMNQESCRLLTYTDWPYEDACICTAQNMAEAGFFHIPSGNEPDLVKCFVCLKELDGWEPEDDPWKEHKRHSPKCAFIKLKKKQSEWTIEDMLKIEVKRQEARVEKACHQKIDKFRDEAEKVKQQLLEM